MLLGEPSQKMLVEELDKYLRSLIDGVRLDDPRAHARLMEVVALLAQVPGPARSLEVDRSAIALATSIVMAASQLPTAPSNAVKWLTEQLEHHLETERGWHRLDRKLAAQVQRSIFRPLDQSCNLGIAHRTQPFDHISGDFVSSTLGPQGLLFAFGDAKGKGQHAALQGIEVLTAIRTLSKRQQSPAPLVHDLNRHLTEYNPETHYSTLIVGHWNSAGRTLRITNGGHEAPLVLRGSVLEKVPSHGPPPGILKTASYGESIVPLQPNDVMAMYSDGVTDRFQDPEDFIEGLELALRRHREKPAEAILLELWQMISSTTLPLPPSDDQTIVVLKAL